jgi:hypothetical protein
MEAVTYNEAKQRFERSYLVQLLKLTEGNVADAARIADRNRTEFYRLLQKYDLTPAMFRNDDNPASGITDMAADIDQLRLARNPNGRGPSGARDGSCAPPVPALESESTGLYGISAPAMIARPNWGSLFPITWLV